MRPTLMIAVLAGIPLAGQVRAQEPPAIRPGARVRITAPQLGLNRHVGSVARVIPDTLVVDTIRVPALSLVRLEVSSGTKSRWLPGAGIGFLLGASVGALGGATVDSCEPTQLVCVAFFGGVGGAVGLLVGGLVGGTVRTDRWQEIALDRLRIAAILERDGLVGLAVSLSM